MAITMARPPSTDNAVDVIKKDQVFRPSLSYSLTELEGVALLCALALNLDINLVSLASLNKLSQESGSLLS